MALSYCISSSLLYLLYYLYTSNQIICPSHNFKTRAAQVEKQKQPKNQQDFRENPISVQWTRETVFGDSVINNAVLQQHCCCCGFFCSVSGKIVNTLTIQLEYTQDRPTHKNVLSSAIFRLGLFFVPRFNRQTTSSKPTAYQCQEYLQCEYG